MKVRCYGSMWREILKIVVVDSKRSQDHHELYQKLIRWELDDELHATEKRLRDWSKERLVSNGLALFDLIAKPDGWLFDQRIVKLRRKSRSDLGQHRFRQGDIVMLSRGDPLSEKPIEAIVSDRRRDSISELYSKRSLLTSGRTHGEWTEVLIG